MRRGIAAPPADLQAAIKAQGDAALKSYNGGIVDLYLAEIKTSIVDDVANGGWPYRSFLVEDDPTLRENLTTALKERFAEKPDAILAYALICPAIYADDTQLVDKAQSYLKDTDPFLYKLEQSRIDVHWRPYIASVKKAQVAQLLGKMLGLIASEGVDREIAPALAQALGLSRNGAAWQIRQLGAKDSADSFLHGFAVGRGADPDLVLSRREPNSIHVFRSSRERQLVSAITVDSSTSQVTTLSPAVAQSDFDSEWKYWYSNVDDLVGAAGTK